jgi:putative transposase
MPRYRRLTAGPTYFFTVVAYLRRPIFCDPSLRGALRQAICTVRISRPFAIDAWVLMPNHMHCIWTLPEGDLDYSKRWGEIKRYVSTACRGALHDPHLLTGSGKKRRESTIWQRRFWEHQIRDDEDFERHVDYVHFNPVKHGFVQKVVEWPHSTFHRYVRGGVYAQDWGGTVDAQTLQLD